MRKQISSIFLITLLLLVIVMPLPASAKVPDIKQLENWLKQHSEGLVKGTFKSANFVIEIPDRAAGKIFKNYPPAVQVMASAVITSKIVANPEMAKIWKAASRVKETEENMQLVGDLTDTIGDEYRKESERLHNVTLEALDEQVDLSKELITGDIKVKEFLEKQASLDKLAEAAVEVSYRMEKHAEKFDTKDLLRILGNEFAQRMSREAMDIVARRATDELVKAVDPGIITIAMEGGFGSESVITEIVEGDISRELRNQGMEYGEDFNRVIINIRKDVLDALKANTTDFRDNWPEIIEKAVMDEIDS
jgi:hypothetical protein